MRFKTTSKDLTLWVNDIHATLKNMHKDSPNAAYAEIRIYAGEVHARTTDRFIIVDSALPGEWIGKGVAPTFGTVTYINLPNWELLKQNVKRIAGIEFNPNGLDLFEHIADEKPWLTIAGDEPKMVNYPPLDNLIKGIEEAKPEISTDGTRDGFRPELVKHIKNCVIEPHSIGMHRAGFLHTTPPRVTGIIMPVRLPQKEL